MKNDQALNRLLEKKKINAIAQSKLMNSTGSRLNINNNKKHTHTHTRS